MHLMNLEISCRMAERMTSSGFHRWIKSTMQMWTGLGWRGALTQDKGEVMKRRQ